MSHHLILTMQLADERRAALTAAARRHRLLSGRRRRAEDDVDASAEIAPLVPVRTPIPEPGTAAFADWASTLGHLAARHGIARLELQVADLCRAARRRGAAPTATEILADRDQPEVARQRALGRVLTSLAAWEAAPRASSEVA